MNLRHILKTFTAVIVPAVIASCGGPKDVEVGPYTVSVIEDNVYHIQDYNAANPAGEAFDAEGNKTHFNNCSDIYLIVGEKEALVIDLSNRIDWADNADESLRAIVTERAGGKPVTVTFTHSHGDHTGMLPAMLDLPGARFALPQQDFARFADRIPEDRREFIREGKVFDLGGMEVETIAVPGHTVGSVVYFLKGHDLLFTGDAIGSGHGVWIFNEDGFYNYVSAVPHLVEWLEDPENGVNLDKLQVYGGHYWQKDWLNLPKGRELGMDYIREMQDLVTSIETGTAATEPSNLGRNGLETYFRNGNAIVTWSADQAEKYRGNYAEKFVLRDQDVVFRQIDEHTWEGNGHLVYNESIYVVEGNDKVLVIDAGSRVNHLDKLVAALTDKPVIMALTHGHGDHIGGIGCFPEVWVHPADESMLRRYEGKVNHLEDGQVFDLGGRQIEVLYTPGHTAGSVTFFDKDHHYGFSGDAFGSTNLLVFTYLSNVVASAAKVEQYIKANDIKFLFPGHYSGDNLESPQRVTDIKVMCGEVLDGKRKPVKSDGNNGGNDMMIEDKGVRITFSSRTGIK